jgi:hypothetical protein
MKKTIHEPWSDTNAQREPSKSLRSSEATLCMYVDQLETATCTRRLISCGFLCVMRCMVVMPSTPLLMMDHFPIGRLDIVLIAPTATTRLELLFDTGALRHGDYCSGHDTSISIRHTRTHS